MNIRHISLLIIFLATGSRAMELSLPEAVRIALEKNRDLIRCGYDLEMASQTYKTSPSEFKPKASFETKAIHSEKEESQVKESSTEYPSQVSFERKYPLFLGSQVKVNSGLKFTKERGSWTANPKVGFELSQPLSKSGIRAGNSSLISRNLDWEIASLSYQENVERIIWEVTLAYYELLKAIKSLDLAGNQLELTRYLLKVSQAKLKAGQIPELDVMRVKMRLSQDEVQIVKAEKKVKAANRTLSVLLGFTQEEDFTLFDKRPVTPIFPEEGIAYKDALSFRLDVKKQELNLKLSEIGLDRVRSQDNPFLVVDGTYQLEGKDKKLQGVIDEFGDKYWEAGLKLSFTLFDGGITKANVKKAILELEKEKSAYEDLKITIRNEIAAIFDDLSSHQKTLEVQGMSLDIARKSYRIAQLKYEEGLVGSADVLEAQLSLFEVENSITEAKISQIIDYVRLQKAIGRLKIKMFLLMK